MHLAIVTHNIMIGDGQSRVAYELVRHSILNGHQVTLIADYVAPELLQLGAAWEPVHPKINRPHLLKVDAFAKQADRTVRRMSYKFDAIQAFGFTLTEPHHANNCQFVHHSWGRSSANPARASNGLYGAYQSFYSFMNTRWEQKAYKAAKRTVASSALIRDQLVASGVSPDRVTVILNGVDVNEFVPGESKRKSLGLPECVPLGLFVGDLRTSRKNLDTVLKALAHLPAAHLAVVGDTNRSPFPEMARKLQVGERTHFLGFRKDIPHIMRSADFFVFPSRYEACSLVLLEAAASGLPIITAQSAGGSEVITPDAGFVLKNPNDVDSLVAGMRTLVQDEGQRHSMGMAARGVAERHTWQNCAESHFRLYNDVAGSVSQLSNAQGNE